MAGFGLFKRLVGGGERRHHAPRVRAAASTRVLIVDDSATIRAVLGKMLNQDGYEVLKAADGASALALARSEPVDLVFLDIVLPGVSGFEVLRTLRREPATARVPIVMISGNVQATEQFYVQRYGADDFMKKPFGREEVFERVRQLVQAGRLKARVETAPVPVAVEEAVPPPGGVSQDEWDAIPDIALPDAAYGEHKPHDLQGLHELHAAVSAQTPEVPVALVPPVTHAAPVDHAPPVTPEPHAVHLPVVHELPAQPVPAEIQTTAQPVSMPAPEAHVAPAVHSPEVAHAAAPMVPESPSAPLTAPEPQQASLPLPEPELPAAVAPATPSTVARPVPSLLVDVPAPAPAAAAHHVSHGMGSATQSALAWLTSRARVLAPSHAKTPAPVGEAHPTDAPHAAKEESAPPRDGA